MSCASALFGSEFSAAEIARARATHGLLTMEIEVGTRCNFLCQYCYVGDGQLQVPEEQSELTVAEIRQVAEQAQELGARKIILLGGEPMLYEFTPELCKWLRDRGLGVELFTNGSNMTVALAARFFALGVQVVLKWHSSNQQIHDTLAGVDGATAIMQEAYRNLRAAGYPSASSRLALSTVICQQNIEELPAMWRWMRREGIEPYFEMITPQGRARQSGDELAPSIEATRRLFATIQAIDHDEFGRVWEAQPPLVGNRCLRHSYSCLVNATGEVMPCVGVTLPLGNIRRQPLARILADSEVIADLRQHTETIQGPCSECEKAGSCYGCRGAAFQLTGNYLGSDPLCWHNQGETDFGALPIAAARLVPHQSPARMVEALTEVGERTATVTASIAATNPYVWHGQLAAAAHLELMAQAAAALHGFRHLRQTSPLRGMLVGARNFELFATLLVGDELTVSLHKEVRFGPFGIIHAEVRRADTLVSTAELKTWHEE